MILRLSRSVVEDLQFGLICAGQLCRPESTLALSKSEVSFRAKVLVKKVTILLLHRRCASLSIMVAEPDSISSEQITDKNSMIQMNLDTYESTITMKQNHDIPISEMMKQMVEVTKTISQRRLQHCTQEQTSDSNALSRDRHQRLHDVIVERVQDSTNETRNTGTGTNEDQMMTERVTVDKG